MSGNNNELVTKTLARAKRKMTLKIIKIVLVCFLVLMFLLSMPRILQMTQRGRIEIARNEVIMIEQFMNPMKVKGYSTQIGSNGFKLPIKLFLLSDVGNGSITKVTTEKECNYNLLSGKLEYHYPYGSLFLHQNSYNEFDRKYQGYINDRIAVNIKTLNKNKGNTVSLINISFMESIELKKLFSNLEYYDLEINFYAVETGYENSKPENIWFGSQQHYTFGIPSELVNVENIFSPIRLSETSLDEYLDLVSDTYAATIEDQKLIKGDKTLLNNDILQLLNNKELMVYGVQLNGPTSELLRFIEDYEVLSIEIQGMDFWSW